MIVYGFTVVSPSLSLDYEQHFNSSQSQVTAVITSAARFCIKKVSSESIKHQIAEVTAVFLVLSEGKLVIAITHRFDLNVAVLQLSYMHVLPF